MGHSLGMWTQILQTPGDCEFRPPATSEQLRDLEALLQLELPDELKALLRLTNGITGKFSEGLLWDTQSIGRRNLELRESEEFAELYMPLDALLFVGDVGNGDLVGYRILKGSVSTLDMFLWEHESDSRRSLFMPLKTYVKQALEGIWPS